jgi:Ca2+-binding RTX toxin-like protein
VICGSLPAAAGAVILKPGDLVVADLDAFGGFEGGIIRIDPATGQQTAVSSNEISTADLFANPMGLVFDARGRILVVELDGVDASGDGGVVRVDPATGQQTAVSSNEISSTDLFEEPSGIALDAAGRILITDFDSQGVGTTGAVIRVDPITGQQTAVSNNLISTPDLFEDPSDIVLDGAGRALVTDREGMGVGNNGAVIRVDPATGQQASVSDENINTGTDLFDTPLGIALDGAGRILVADGDSQGVSGNGAVIRVDPVTGQQTAVSNDTINTGTDLFNTPTGDAVDPSGAILVTEADTQSAPFTGAVIRVDPVSGQQTALSTNEISGPDLLSEPGGVAVFPGFCRGRLATITGTPARNVITGTPGVDVVVSLGGNDVVRGLGAGDVVCGGAGNDRLVGGAGKDLLLGEAGKDRLLGGKGRDRLLGGKGRDRLRGGPGRDRLRGGPGRDLQVQ